MSTRAHSSAVFPLPIDTVWSALRDFTFPQRYISTIKSVTLENKASPDSVGAIRHVEWNTGETRKHRLIELSDQYRRLTWELVESDPPTEASAVISTLQLYRISETNHTLVEWASDFSADATGKFVLFEQNSYLENLKEIRTKLIEDEEFIRKMGRGELDHSKGWGGFYKQEEAIGEMTFTSFKISDGKVTGEGTDGVGDFKFSGTYNEADRSLALRKHYDGFSWVYDASFRGNKTFEGEWHPPEHQKPRGFFRLKYQ